MSITCSTGEAPQPANLCVPLECILFTTSLTKE